MVTDWLRKQVYRVAWLRLAYAAFSTLRGRLKRASITQDGNQSTIAEVVLSSGLKLFVDPRDQKGLRYLRKVNLGTDLHRLWQHAATNYDVLVDAGANYGEYLLVLIEAGAITGQSIHAFEPNPEVFSLQAKTLASAGIERAVQAHCMGLSDEPGELTFYINRDDSGASSSNALQAINPARGIHLKRHTIQVVSGDVHFGEAITAKTRIAIKIDTEGHDFRVLSGFRRSLMRSANYYIALEADRRAFEAGLEILGSVLIAKLFETEYFVYYDDCLHLCLGLDAARDHYSKVANNLDIVLSNDPELCSYARDLAHAVRTVN